MPVRQDYLLTQIEQLRRFVARVLAKREPAGLDEALRLAFDLQEKLFPLPPVEFLQLDVARQIEALRTGETKPNGEIKCLTYAELLSQTATLYHLRDRDDLAAGARQLALHVVLSLALEQPASPAPVHALIEELLKSVDPEHLHPPARELLDAYHRTHPANDGPPET